MSTTFEPRVETVMERDPPVAHLHETLDRARERLSGGARSTLVVVDGDRIAAVLSHSALEQHWRDAGHHAGIALRDLVRPPVAFCYAQDSLAAARSALTIAAAKGIPTDAIAVVDDDRRLLGVAVADRLGDAPPGGSPRAPADATDRSRLEHPRLDVYAPWAALSG